MPSTELVHDAIDLPQHGERIRLHGRFAAEPADDRPVLLMAHGSTYAAGATYDLPIDGRSMLDLLALAGIDAWALDVVGYGASSRPPAMAAAPERGAPVSRTADAAANVAAATDYLLDRYGRARIALLGWSWGTAVMGAYAASHPDKVARLVQIAPLWLRDGPSATDPGGELGAYRVVEVSGVRARWTKQMAPADADRLAPPGVADALERALLAADAAYAADHPGRIHVPNGTVADTRAFWSAGRPLYDAGAIRCPVLVIGAAWDREWPVEISRRYADALTGAASVERVVVPEASHSVILEPGRDEVCARVIAFVADGTPRSGR